MNRLGQRGETMLGWNGDAYAARANAFGWHAIEIDGHNLDEIDRAYDEATRVTDAPTLIVARTIKGKGFSEIENKDGWHGKALPQDMADRAIQELGGVRNLVVQVAEAREPPASGAPGAAARSVAEAMKKAHRWRRARPMAMRSRRSARREPDVVAVDGEVSNSTYAETFAKAYPRPLLRAVHRRAADGRGGGGLAGARLHALRLDLRGLLHARLRLHPHGGRLAGQHPPRRLARRRLDRRGRPVADGAGRPGDDARGLRQHGALSQRREPDGAARRGDGRHARASPSCARRARRRR